jgi:hypothetical protein
MPSMVRGLLIGFVVVAIAGVDASPAQALLVCARKDKTGAVKSGAPMRIRAACTPKEVAVDPQALGWRGPRAYGRIAATGELDPAYASAGLVGARNDGSYHCVKLDPSIDASTAIPVVTLDGNESIGPLFGGGNSEIPFVLALPGLLLCNEGNEIGVATGGIDFSSGLLSLTFIGPSYGFYIQVP